MAHYYSNSKLHIHTQTVFISTYSLVSSHVYVEVYSK